MLKLKSVAVVAISMIATWAAQAAPADKAKDRQSGADEWRHERADPEMEMREKDRDDEDRNDETRKEQRRAEERERDRKSRDNEREREQVAQTARTRGESEG